MKKIILLLFLLSAFFCSNAQWSSDPNLNQSLSDFKIYNPEQQIHPNGDVYLFYLSPTTGVIKSYFQIFDKNGQKKFGENGLLISDKPSRLWTVVNNHLIIDKDGNAIIVIADSRTSTTTQYKSVSYFAYKISPSGEFLWGKDGIDLNKGKNYYEEACMRILEVGNQYLFAWGRWPLPNMGTTEAPTHMQEGEFSDEIQIISAPVSAIEEKKLPYIVMERLDKDGKFVGETQYLQDESIPYSYPWICNAGNGQVILVYAKGSNQDLMARKLDFDGSSVWAQDAIVYRGGFGGIPIWTFVEVYEDPQGGVFVCWHDDRDFTNIESGYISYIKADGTYGYASGIEGQKIGFSGFRQFHPTMAYNPSDKSTYLVWSENDINQVWNRVCAQRLSKEGDLMWDINGIEILPLARRGVGYVSCQIDDQNRLAAFFMTQDSLEIYGKTKGYASLVGPDGKFIWESKLVALTIAKSEKGSFKSSRMVENQWITLWTDKRGNATGANENFLFGQNIQGNGNLGTNVSNEILKNSENGFHLYPNPTNSQAHFLVEVAQTGNINLTIYNNIGQKVSTLFKGNIAAGTHEFLWSSNLLPKGIYIAVLNNNGKISNLKIIHK